MDQIVKQKFCEIYREKTWKRGESVSGSGSDADQTEMLKNYLLFLIAAEDVSTIVDCPCGDMNWQMPLVERVRHYVGCDIVPEIVADNIDRLIMKADKKPTNLGFRVLDVITDDIPPCDLLIVRDCFVHLTNEMVLAALKNIARSDVKLVALTTFANRPSNNVELTDEQWNSPDTWRPLNMRTHPFVLPFPKYQFIEQCTEGDGTQFRDKCLSVWTIEHIRATQHE